MEDTAFFDSIQSEPVAYWFGFFCADGHLYSSGKQVAILLAAKDAGHLTKFASQFIFATFARVNIFAYDVERVLRANQSLATMVESALNDRA
jgi:hypothetical protein